MTRIKEGRRTTDCGLRRPLLARRSPRGVHDKQVADAVDTFGAKPTTLSRMKSYFVRKPGGAEAGPFAAEALRQMARAGLLSLDAEIRETTNGAWFPLSRVPELAGIIPGTLTLALDDEPECDSRSDATAAAGDAVANAPQPELVTVEAVSGKSVDKVPQAVRPVPDDAEAVVAEVESRVTTVAASVAAASLVPTEVAPLVDRPRPWVRLWARYFDVWIFVLPTSYLIGFAFATTDPVAAARFFANPVSGWVVGMVCSFLWVFVEAGFLATFGTTPGKAWLRVRVRTSDSMIPTFPTALTRSFLVWLGGTGLGIPLVAMITQLFSYSRLTSRGSTWWDDSCGLKVECRRIGAVRTVLFVTMMIGLLFAMSLLNALARQQ